MAKSKKTAKGDGMASDVGMVGGAAAGAAAGSILGPIGAAVGAVVGGVAGADVRSNVDIAQNAWVTHIQAQH